MRYFVRASDGQTYGPVDAATLRQWAAEGRVIADTWLQEEGSGILLRAGDIPELQPYLPLIAAPITPQGPPGFPCPNCGAALPPRAILCGRCGARPYAVHERKLTGMAAVDMLLGVLTVAGICVFTVLLSTTVKIHLPFGGLTAMLPIIGPIVLYATLSRTYRAYSNGLLTGCCLLPALLAGVAAMGIYKLVGTPWSAPTMQWKCFG